MDAATYLKRLLFEKPPYAPWKKGNCVTDSIYGAQRVAWERGVPTRIAITKLSQVPDIDHAQPQAFLNGKWEWLTTHHNTGETLKWTQHFPGEPYRYVPVEEFMKEQEGIEHTVPEGIEQFLPK